MENMFFTTNLLLFLNKHLISGFLFIIKPDIQHQLF